MVAMAVLMSNNPNLLAENKNISESQPEAG